MKRLVAILLLSAWTAAGWCAGGDLELLSVKTDLGNKPSLQRGARLYVNYCLGCHSLSCVTTEWDVIWASRTNR